MLLSQKVVVYIEEKLQATWSTEQIACTSCELKMLSWRTIYRLFYKKYLAKSNPKYCSARESAAELRKHEENTTTGNRSKKGKLGCSHQKVGHWETHTAVNGHRKSSACFAILVECKTSFYIAEKIPNLKAEAMQNPIVSVPSAFPSHLVKAIDRSTEFANWHKTKQHLYCYRYYRSQLRLAEGHK